MCPVWLWMLCSTQCKPCVWRSLVPVPSCVMVVTDTSAPLGALWLPQGWDSWLTWKRFGRAPGTVQGSSCCRALGVFSSRCLPACSLCVGAPGDALLELICFSLCKGMPRKSLGCRRCPWVLPMLAPATSLGDKEHGVPPCPQVPPDASHGTHCPAFLPPLFLCSELKSTHKDRIR